MYIRNVLYRNKIPVFRIHYNQYETFTYKFKCLIFSENPFLKRVLNYKSNNHQIWFLKDYKYVFKAKHFFVFTIFKPKIRVNYLFQNKSDAKIYNNVLDVQFPLKVRIGWLESDFLSGLTEVEELEPVSMGR